MSNAYPASVDNANGETKPQRLCQQCVKNSPIYTCPACSTVSCSLSCCKRHKIQTGCSGKRSKVDFVKLTEFNDKIITKDFRLLEETQYMIESSARYLLKRRNCDSKGVIRKASRDLKRRCDELGINLCLAPSEMASRLENTSQLSKKSKKIQWRISWVFPAANFLHTDPRITEESFLHSQLSRILDANHSSQAFSDIYCIQGIDSLRILMKDLSESHHGKFVELDKAKKIGENLIGKTIREFPEFIVVTEPELGSYLELNKYSAV